MKMLINADIGEMTGHDTEIMPHIDIGNIACGGHASDPEHMAETVQLAIFHGVKISAHPSYNDRENFGRISHSLTSQEILELIESQVQLLDGICKSQGTTLYSIKPHGALYHDMMKFPHVKEAIIATAQKCGLILIVPAQSATDDRKQWQLPILREVFADRGYSPDGSIIARSELNAIHIDPEKIVAQSRQFIIERSVVSSDGSLSHLPSDTLCFHGDNPASIQALKMLHAEH